MANCVISALLVVMLAGLELQTVYAAVCIPGYEFLPGAGCYKGNKLKVDWDTAERFCQVDGTHLAVPQTSLQMEAIIQMAKPLESATWVGLKNVGGKWVTVEGVDYGSNNYTGWAPGKPGTMGSCAVAATWGLGDYSCDDVYAYVCQESK